LRLRFAAATAFFQAAFFRAAALRSAIFARLYAGFRAAVFKMLPPLRTARFLVVRFFVVFRFLVAMIFIVTFLKIIFY
jgi:hypothetical protein